MRPILSCLALAILFVHAPVRAAEPPPLLAVLDFDAPDGGVEPSDLQVLSDAFRSAVIKETGDRYKVMTRETMMEMVPPEQMKCFADKCVAEIGRMLQAPYIMAGAIRKLGSRKVLTIEAYESVTGRALGTEQLVGASTEDLFVELGEQSRGLVRDWLRLNAAPTPAVEATAQQSAASTPAQASPATPEPKAAPTAPSTATPGFDAEAFARLSGAVFGAMQRQPPVATSTMRAPPPSEPVAIVDAEPAQAASPDAEDDGPPSSDALAVRFTAIGASGAVGLELAGAWGGFEAAATFGLLSGISAGYILGPLVARVGLVVDPDGYAYTTASAGIDFRISHLSIVAGVGWFQGEATSSDAYGLSGVMPELRLGWVL